MKLFIDTANVEEIRKANELGVICGVTTNPSLIAKEGRDFIEVVREISGKVFLLIAKILLKINSRLHQTFFYLFLKKSEKLPLI